MRRELTVTVIDEERAAEFRAVFGSDTVPVKSIVPVVATLDHLEGEQEVYMLDLDALTNAQHDRLVAHLARKFDAREADVEGALKALGMPILAKDCVVSLSARMF